MALKLYEIESLGIIRRWGGSCGVTSYTNPLLVFLQTDLCIVKRYDLPCINVTTLCFKFDTFQNSLFLQVLSVFSLRDQIFLKV